MKISEAESQVMEVFWSASAALSADEVVAAMGNSCDWSAGTIRTFLTRLLNLIDRLFGGRIAPFITQFSERRDISRDEIAELKRLIKRLEHDR